MQLKKKKIQQNMKPVYQSLAIATCTLLSNVSQDAQAHDVEGRDLDLSIGFLDYVESERVRVRETDHTVRWQMNDDVIISGSFIFDSITGATPTGAIRPVTAAQQSATTASGTGGSSGVGGSGGAGLKPLAPIVDRRVAFGGQIEKNLTRSTKYKVGGLFSSEDDYTSYGASGLYAMELNNKLTTVEGGIAVSFDLVRPDGGPPPVGDRPFNVNTLSSLDDGEKRTIDASVSVTQILNHRTVTKLTFSTGIAEGYLEDPYKVVPLVDTNGNASDIYFHENRPDSRLRNALVFDMNHQPLEEDVFQVQYRYFWDDWDMKSHTLDLRYRHQLGRNYLTPHLRLYNQSKADFYHHFLRAADQNPGGLDINGNVIDPIGVNAPRYASADTRLDDMFAITLGVKFGIEGPLGHFRIRWDILRQQGKDSEFESLHARFLQLAWTLNLE